MKDSSDRLTIIAAFVWAAAFVGARLLLEQPDLALWQRLALALGPTFPFALLLWGAIRMSRGLDEMQRRVQIEALAFGFGLTALLVATLALAQKAGLVGEEDFSFVHLLPVMFVFYLSGRILAGRRYGCETE